MRGMGVNVCRILVGRPEEKRRHLVDLDTDSSVAIPLQTWTGPEGSRRLRLSDFKTIGT